MDNIRVLIVEDEIETMELMKHCLERCLACMISAANNGEDALGKIKRMHFDLIILDIKMPGLSGLDVLKRIKVLRDHPDILVVTAWDSAQVAEEAIKEGATDYIPKPVTLDILQAKVKTILGKKRKLS